LAPCFWHREIVASDLGSHLYNAWLVQLIHRGQSPGLWIAPQRTNILFDILLSNLGSIFGLHVAEKLTVSLAVLIFFWGTFALMSAAVQRPPWSLLPCIALVTYGWTFHLGFFNYYLSLGLSFFGLALWWRGKAWEKFGLLVIAPFVFMAHPLGLIWLLGAAAYIGIAEMLPRRPYQWLFCITVAALLFAVHIFIWHHYAADPGAKPFYAFNGADQLVLFGERYRVLARALLAFAALSILLDLVLRRRESGLLNYYDIPIQLYILAMFSVLVLPDAIHFPPPTATIALLTERLTSITAVIGCCVLGAMHPRKWHFAATAVIASVFFVFLYRDTAIVNCMEAQVAQLVSKLPPNQRVLATIEPFPGSRILNQHIIDRACIGRCFSYGNYEPGSRVFRVRATPGNPYVLDSYELATETEEGDYLVQPRDLPVYQVYQCSENGIQICMRPLKPGEYNDEPRDE
ncbi:MAG: hypothetical protein ACRD3B_05300, partial [Candidatus Sulfotelmatobacter sp.]